MHHLRAQKKKPAEAAVAALAPSQGSEEEEEEADWNADDDDEAFRSLNPRASSASWNAGADRALFSFEGCLFDGYPAKLHVRYLVECTEVLMLRLERGHSLRADARRLSLIVPCKISTATR